VREPQEGEERAVEHIDPITSRGELVEIGATDLRTPHTFFSYFHKLIHQLFIN
jgi:hypothetical protein